MINILPLSTILDNISVTETKKRITDYEDIDEFIRYVKKINTMDDVDETELSFVNNMVEKIWMEKINISSSNEEEEEKEDEKKKMKKTKKRYKR